jgi:hypothetical protein
MRFLSVLFVAVLSCQIANAQPASKELITKFRKVIGAEAASESIPFLIQYRGERYLYSLRDGRLVGESFEFQTKRYGYSDKHNQHRVETEMKIGVVPLKIVEVISGNSGWYQMNEGEAVTMSKGEIEGKQKREHHVEVFLGRERFDPKLWQFSDPKSTQVQGHDAWMFEAKTKGMEPLALYFAKQSGLLLRLKSKTTDFAWLPGETPKLESFTRDLYFRDWKPGRSRMLPGYIQEFRDGVLWRQMEPVSVNLGEAIDPKLFAAPQPKK